MMPLKHFVMHSSAILCIMWWNEFWLYQNSIQISFIQIKINFLICKVNVSCQFRTVNSFLASQHLGLSKALIKFKSSVFCFLFTIVTHKYADAQGWELGNYFTLLWSPSYVSTFLDMHFTMDWDQFWSCILIFIKI